MTSKITPLTPEREQEIRDSIPTVYGPPWTVHPDMDNDVWRVMYATDHPLAGLVAEVPDYGAHLAEFIAEARAAVPELLAELDRLRAQLTEQQGENAKLIRWHGEDDAALGRMRDTIVGLRVELAEATAAVPAADVTGE